jgi:hypothetical protein
VKHYCDPSNCSQFTRKHAAAAAGNQNCESERERERDWRQSGRICNATGYLLQWKKIQKQISHFCGLFGWLLGQTALLQIFQKNKNSCTLIGNLGSLGERKNKDKKRKKENQDNAWSAHYFILFSIA